MTEKVANSQINAKLLTLQKKIEEKKKEQGGGAISFGSLTTSAVNTSSNVDTTSLFSLGDLTDDKEKGKNFINALYMSFLNIFKNFPLYLIDAILYGHSIVYYFLIRMKGSGLIIIDNTTNINYNINIDDRNGLCYSN